MPEEIVYALHNFEAENEDEISFTTGEPIVVLEKDEKYQDGWWQVITLLILTDTLTGFIDPPLFFRVET